VSHAATTAGAEQRTSFKKQAGREDAKKDMDEIAVCLKKAARKLPQCFVWKRRGTRFNTLPRPSSASSLMVDAGNSEEVFRRAKEKLGMKLARNGPKA
jgi:hypothetical protein